VSIYDISGFLYRPPRPLPLTLSLTFILPSRNLCFIPIQFHNNNNFLTCPSILGWAFAPFGRSSLFCLSQNLPPLLDSASFLPLHLLPLLSPSLQQPRASKLQLSSFLPSLPSSTFFSIQPPHSPAFFPRVSKATDPSTSVPSSCRLPPRNNYSKTRRDNNYYRNE
jgi:hypothetical protein